MKKLTVLCISLLFALLASAAFCGELKVVKYSESALDRALSDNMPVALWFTDDDDYDCRLLERDMLDNGQFVAAMEDMIWLKIDLTGPANKARYRNLCTEFNVTKIPSVIYLNSDGREYTESRTTGYKSSDDILAALIAGAVIGWLVNDGWNDDYYYNNRIVYRNNGWWRNDRDWVLFDGSYFFYDPYLYYRHPEIWQRYPRHVFPSKKPGHPGVRPPLPPGQYRFPEVIDPGKRPDVRPPMPPGDLPDVIGRPGERPDRPSVTDGPGKPAGRPDRPSVTDGSKKPGTAPGISRPSAKPGSAGRPSGVSAKPAEPRPRPSVSSRPSEPRRDQFRPSARPEKKRSK